MQRVMIVGGPGAGKTTLAIRLGDITGLPVFHMDRIHWKAGWIERSRDDKDRLTRAVHLRERWILEGGHSRTYGDRVARADAFVWLDFPVRLRLWRIVRRTIVWHGQTRPDLPEGCPERLNRETFRFLRFVWRTRASARAKLAAIHADPPAHLRTCRLTSLGAIEAFLAEVAQPVVL